MLGGWVEEREGGWMKKKKNTSLVLPFPPPSLTPKLTLLQAQLAGRLLGAGRGGGVGLCFFLWAERRGRESTWTWIIRGGGGRGGMGQLGVGGKATI